MPRGTGQQDAVCLQLHGVVSNLVVDARVDVVHFPAAAAIKEHGVIRYLLTEVGLEAIYAQPDELADVLLPPVNRSRIAEVDTAAYERWAVAKAVHIGVTVLVFDQIALGGGFVEDRLRLIVVNQPR